MCSMSRCRAAESEMTHYASDSPAFRVSSELVETRAKSTAEQHPPNTWHRQRVYRLHIPTESDSSLLLHTRTPHSTSIGARARCSAGSLPRGKQACCPGPSASSCPDCPRFCCQPSSAPHGPHNDHTHSVPMWGNSVTLGWSKNFGLICGSEGYTSRPTPCSLSVSSASNRASSSMRPPLDVSSKVARLGFPTTHRAVLTSTLPSFMIDS